MLLCGGSLKVLFVGNTRIGDFILTSGLLRNILETYPQSRITLAVGAPCLPLTRHIPNIERIIPIQKRPWNLHWWDLWKEVSGERWDLVIDLRDSIISRAVRADKIYRRLRPIGRHRVEEAARVLGLVPAPAPKIWISDEERAYARTLLPAGRPLFALGPGANYAPKCWPAINFGELAARLTGRDGALENAHVIVLGAPNETGLAAMIGAALPKERFIDLTSRANLLQTAAILEHCALFIGNDSGQMHIAAAMGTPTLGLFGPTRAELYRPWGENCSYVCSETPLDQLLEMEKSDPTRKLNLMGGLTVEKAVDAASAHLLGRGRA